jgi:hypothetical protein
MLALARWGHRRLGQCRRRLYAALIASFSLPSVSPPLRAARAPARRLSSALFAEPTPGHRARAHRPRNSGFPPRLALHVDHALSLLSSVPTFA